MSLSTKIVRYYLPVVLWGVFIFLLSSQSNLPGPNTALLDFVFKKSSHMFVYAVLYWLVFRALNAGRSVKTFSVAFFLCLAYAASDELHQSFTPGRTPAVRDIGYDALGMSIAILRLKSLI